MNNYAQECIKHKMSNETFDVCQHLQEFQLSPETAKTSLEFWATVLFFETSFFFV